VMGEVWITVYPIHTGSGGARSLFLLGHKWGTIISKGGGHDGLGPITRVLAPSGRPRWRWVGARCGSPFHKGARGC